jgi:hypothetical protein
VNANINFAEIPRTVQIDLCEMAAKSAAEYLRDPEHRADYERWLRERRGENE